MKLSTNKVILSLFIIIGLLILVILIKHLFFPPSFEEILKDYTNEINKGKMTMVDKEVRFDSCIILPNRIFQFNSTLVNQDSISWNITEVSKEMYPILLNRTKTYKSYQILRDNKATFSFRYSDKNGNFMFEVSFKPDEYLN